MSPCDYDLFAKVKESLRRARQNTRDGLTRRIGRSIRNINKDRRDDGVGFLRKIWQKVITWGGDYIEGTYCTCCTPVNKVMSELSNCYRYFIYPMGGSRGDVK